MYATPQPPEKDIVTDSYVKVGPIRISFTLETSVCKKKRGGYQWKSKAKRPVIQSGKKDIASDSDESFW